ncbi:protein FAM171A2 isoform X2 [Clinocottus analis]|uniref:protein FAM171A2 isoform X2 n=1 Tax=Clinocottus analis TaxID=304258 RepID=UPI0035BF156A
MPARYISRLLLFVSICAAKSLPDPGAVEVQIKVQVFDNSDLSPLAGAQVEVHGNQTALASSRAGDDGVLRVSFLYRTGSWVIISASKQDYVTNSVPWHSGRIPLYASVSLYLLVQRPGTLILYDDVLQVLSGSPGARSQPLVQLQRKSLQLPPGANGTALSATLTTARTQYEIGGFPFLLGQETNSTGAETGWTDLTALAVFSVQLLDKDGAVLQVSDPIHVSVPLPSDTRNRMATSVPAWLYQPKTGLWVRNGTGYIKKDGQQFVWNVVVPQMGYWLAAFPSSSGLDLSHPGLRDITTYHTLFLLSILASLALLVLILLCVLLYYCRRKCLKPRRQQGKPHSANLNGAKRDQGTSTSRLNLICGGHAESGPANDKSEMSPSRDYQSSREDLTKHVPAHMLRHAKGKSASGPQRGESFPMKVTRATETNNLDNPLLHEDYNRSYSPMEGKESEYHRHHANANDNRGYASDPPSPPRFQCYVPNQTDKPPEYSAAAADGLARPTSLNTQAGQIIFCSSIDQMKENMYRSMVPTLVIPAHYMRLPSEFSKDGKDQKDQDKDGAQTGGGQHHHSQKQGGSQGDNAEDPSWASDSSGGPMTIPVLFNDSTMAQMNGELQALTEKKLLELGVKQHPRAWFISLDGRNNAHVRHSYIDAGNDLSGGGGFLGGPSSAGRDVNLEPPLEGQERKSGINRKGKDERWGTGGRKGLGVGSGGLGGGKCYSKLAYSDHGESGGGGGGSEGRPVSPEENSLTPLLDEGPSSRGSTIPRRGRSRVNSSRSSNSENRRDSMTSPEDDPDDKDENKKSPWQKIEDRPLMVFHPRK